MEVTLRIGSATVKVDVPFSKNSCNWWCYGISIEGDYEEFTELDHYVDNPQEFAEDFAFGLIIFAQNHTLSFFFFNFNSEHISVGKRLQGDNIGGWKIELPKTWYVVDFDNDNDILSVEFDDDEDDEDDLKIYDSRNAVRSVDKYVAEKNLFRRIFEAYKFCERAKDVKKWRDVEKLPLPGSPIYTHTYSSPNIQSSALDVLEKMIGISSVKEEVKSLINFVRFRKARMDKGLMVTPSTLHLVFTGAPGTGKTTVARLIAQIYKDIGLLTKGHLVEVSRTDLVGEYVGHTAPKTTEKFKEAIGGVLFIDEAYSLSVQGSEKDFGKEAIDTLVALMENYREKIVIIVAGYSEPMKMFIQSNPGLDSRFPTKIHFDDFNNEELLEIFKKKCEEQSYTLTSGAIFKAQLYIENNNFSISNGRGIRSLFEGVERNLAGRLSSIVDPTKEELTTITDQDIPDPESK